MDLDDLYSEKYDFATRDRQPDRSIMIATIPRSGSTFLSMLLWATGGTGAPLEYLNLPLRERDMMTRFGNGSIIQYWRELQIRRTSPNGVFSFKAFLTDYVHAIQHSREFAGQVSSDQTIYLTRRDKISQAVSLARAAKTGQWVANAQRRETPDYSYDSIAVALNDICEQEGLWETLFISTNCIPYRLDYEDLAADTKGTIGDLTTWLDVESKPILYLPVTKVQRDDLSESWGNRFREDLARRNAE